MGKKGNSTTMGTEMGTEEGTTTTEVMMTEANEEDTTEETEEVITIVAATIVLEESATNFETTRFADSATVAGSSTCNKLTTHPISFFNNAPPLSSGTTVFISTTNSSFTEATFQVYSDS